MYTPLLFFHSLFRWLVLTSLLYALVRSFKGYRSGAAFSAADNRARHWTATIAHIQLLLGFALYGSSPVVKYFWRHPAGAPVGPDHAFFGIVHILLMLASVVVVTIGSSLARRRASDREKFGTMLFWFSLALLLLIIAIPWPFSPFAHRPYFRAL